MSVGREGKKEIEGEGDRGISDRSWRRINFVVGPLSSRDAPQMNINCRVKNDAFTKGGEGLVEGIEKSGR